MKKLLNYLLELLIIAGKLVIFSIVFQILVSILTGMLKSPIVWYRDNISLDSKAFILYLAYVFVSIVVFYIVGRFALRFKAKKLTNIIFAVIVFLMGTSAVNAFGKNEFYSIVSPYFNFHDWFNFDITLALFGIGGIHNYMQICEWLIISLALYFGMSSEIVYEGAGLGKYHGRANRNVTIIDTVRKHEGSGEIKLKKFTDEEKDKVYGTEWRDHYR